MPALASNAVSAQLSHEFRPAGILVITGANSAVGLRSMPARYLFFDEVDAYGRAAHQSGLRILPHATPPARLGN